MRGGKRPNAGRKPGSTVRPRAAAALLAATPEGGEPPLSTIEAMREALTEARQLAKTARAAGDAANHKYWFDRVAQIARDLAPYECPKLQAVMQVPPSDGTARVTRFPLLIFDSQRKPLDLELKPDNAAAPAPSPEPVESKPAADAEVVAGEVLPPSEEASKPDAPQSAEAKPDEPEPDAAAREAEAKVVWRRSQQWTALFGGVRQPCGSRHRW
jgi:hypothetical protein